MVHGFVISICILLYTYAQETEEIADSYGCPVSRPGRHWRRFRTRSTCYVTQPRLRLTFGAAEMWCRANGGHVAMPKDLSEVQNIAAMATEMWVWLGLDDLQEEGRWVWADGTVAADQQKRRRGVQLDNAGGNRHCVTFNKIAREFNAEYCTVEKSFVCETTKDGHEIQFLRQRERCPREWFYFDSVSFWYWVSKEKVDYSTARDTCRAKAAEFAMPKTNRQQRALYLLSNPQHPGKSHWQAWLGLRENTKHERTWVNGRLADWSRFPNDGRFHGRDISEFRGNLATNYSSEERFYICQKPQTKSRIQITYKPREKREGAMVEYKRLYSSSFVSKQSRLSEMELRKIKSGQDASINEFPWMAKIYEITNMSTFTLDFLCGASVIGRRWLVTAAHCLTHLDDQPKHPEKLVISWGSRHIDWEQEKSTNVSNSVFPPEFSLYMGNRIETDKMDIGVVEVTWPLPAHVTAIEFRHPISLDNKDCVVIGFGAGSGKTLKKCSLKGLFDVEGRQLRVNISDKQTCQNAPGDSGSPVMCRVDGVWKLLGVVNGQIFSKGPNKKVIALAFTPLKRWKKWIQHVMDTAKYTAYLDKLPHGEASTACGARGGLLAMPKTWRDQKDMMAAIKRWPGAGLQFWFGLKSTAGAWQWIDESALGKWNAFKTATFQKDLCVAERVLDPSDDISDKNFDAWIVDDCREAHQYVCQYPSKPTVNPATVYKDMIYDSKFDEITCDYGQGSSQAYITVVNAFIGHYLSEDELSYKWLCTGKQNVTSNISQRCNGENRCIFQATEYFMNITPTVSCAFIRDLLDFEVKIYTNVTYRCEALNPSTACIDCGTYFQCESDCLCVNPVWLCDGESDCVDGSDEKNCGDNNGNRDASKLWIILGCGVSAGLWCVFLL